jgi:hypothetical protein
VTECPLGRGSSTRINFSDSRRSKNTINTQKYNAVLYIPEEVITTLVHILSLQKVEAPKDASKDITEFVEAVSLTFRTFSLP